MCFCVFIYNLGSHITLFAKSHTIFNACLTGAAAITYLFPYLSFSLPILFFYEAQSVT